ncbi:PilZ domain-containing protein [Shewanella sp. WXL01]|uniref:Cyclic diguanosine monophosphate-binding protein n=1 Tax=Shewanella maritima TaxID=2520507 RepID=A0A411PF24_9GAMM|nr:MULTISPECIES: PilZ domain-containing protein [Shewanella]NKF49729.1 PilZ domain-containing protein [Shewanella sp. WXL01]QBF82189.1 PilZ domain-containing protein [Shewanella maritima]
MDERRKFSRTLFAASAYIIQTDQSWRTKILDLSLNGALVKRPDNFTGQVNTGFKLEFILPDSDVELHMETTLIHKTPEYLGLKCHHIDVESISHLRRIIELNVGDAELLNREIELLAELKDNE